MDCDKKYLEKCKKKIDTPVKKPKILKETEIFIVVKRKNTNRVPHEPSPKGKGGKKGNKL
tara:strand:+ start:562 stop:741 length:180 start_codon:yes stop_codon:yes gene_type:complete